jgi:hypothetical protein
LEHSFPTIRKFDHLHMLILVCQVPSKIACHNWLSCFCLQWAARSLAVGTLRTFSKDIIKIWHYNDRLTLWQWCLLILLNNQQLLI